MARFTHTPKARLRNLDVISVSQKFSIWRWVKKPVSMAISWMISKQLDNTEIGNEFNVSHTAIYLDGYIYEIHVNALNKIHADQYFDDIHDYYISQMRKLDFFNSIALKQAYENARHFLDHVFVHQKKRTEYDKQLILKIFHHLRRGTLENIKTDLKDLDFICSELVQLTLESAIGDNISNRVMLPNDFFNKRFRFYKF